MNVTKNGILVDCKPRGFNAITFHRNEYNPYKHFATLYRVEDHTPVWLVMPFKKKEINQLKREGWKVIEVWEPTKKGVRNYGKS
ncbi:hypothetical protein MKY29_12145 [Psychrobacillus sp. FSL K6-2365]|uniref:hypothetical protein n=1 Tax=Psychrobacillus sp. FSL K6-2365 TaxID=2921546 RepID=UPI0030F7B8FB